MGVIRRWLVRWSVAWLLAVCAATSPAAPREFRLTILHSNDQHGHLLPFAYAEPGRHLPEQPSVGGIARRSGLARRIRAATHHPVLLLDAGDIFTRGPFCTTYQGAPEVAAMNAAGYQAACIGNNEFKARDGVDVEDAAGSQAALLKVIRTSRFPWICANVAGPGGARLPGVRPYVVLRRGGLRIGLLGLTAPRSKGYPQTRGWNIGDAIDAARKWVPRVRAECDVLIALTHLGVALDGMLVASVPGIDAVVGGDSHTFLYQPMLMRDPSGRDVPIVQAGEFGANLGRLDLRFARDAAGKWRRVAYKGRLIPVGASAPTDPGVERALAPYVRPFLAPVGRLVSVGSTPAARSLITTRVLVLAMQGATGADAAINPDGGGMFDSFHSRTVTRLDLFSAMPFHNNVVVVTMPGAELRRHCGQTSVQTVCTLPVDAIDDGRSYSVAMVDYMASTVYSIDKDRPRQTGIDVRQATIEFLRREAPPGSGTGRAQ